MANVSGLIAAMSDMRGLSGREDTVSQKIADMVSHMLTPDTVIANGSVIAHIGHDPEKPTVMLCAHLDQVGFLVTDITPEGFLRIGAVGGIDHRLLLGQPVTVYGKERLFGVISILPPHLLKGEQTVPEDAQLCVDLGYDSADALAELVQRGDAVYFGTKSQMLQNDYLTGSALDDRCGAAAVILTAEVLRDEVLPCNLTLCFSAQEERGGRGAVLVAANEHADYAIAVDVTFGLAYGENPKECMELGKGPAIGISPVLSQTFSDTLIDIAKDMKLPHQLEIMPGMTGTDADALALAPDGCETVTVSIPLRNMHTPVEVIAVSDVEKTICLLAEFIRRCGRE